MKKKVSTVMKMKTGTKMVEKRRMRREEENGAKTVQTKLDRWIVRGKIDREDDE